MMFSMAVLYDPFDVSLGEPTDVVPVIVDFFPFDNVYIENNLIRSQKERTVTLKTVISNSTSN